MVYQNLEFHNVDHLEEVPGMEGLRLERFPKALTASLGIPENRKGRFRAKRVHGCEIRFVTEAPFFDLCVTAAEADIDAVICCGDMVHTKHTLKAGAHTVLHVEYPEMYKQVDEKRLTQRRFAPYVWRIQFGMNGSLYFHYLDTYGFPCRPPREGEKPEILWAAYGSSITCGSKTTAYSNAYVEQAAWRLKYDVLNKGLSGSCLCEPEMAEYLAGLPVDILTLELGVNMMLNFNEETFERQIRRFLQTIKESGKAKQICVIDIFTNRAPILNNHEHHYYRHYDNFRNIVKTVALELQDPRITWIDASAIAKDLAYLSTDLLHPSDNGHISMGEHLARAMQKE